MACDQNLMQQIVQEAQAQGVDPGIALSVATQESGICQWNPDGSLVTGSSGEIGLFQLMPATASQLGVDPTDPGQNIKGGVSYLKQMFDKFGNWVDAVAGYNAGPGAVAAGKIPSSTQSYVQSVLARAGISNGILSSAASGAASALGGNTGTLIVLGVAAAAALLVAFD